ncbi:MAG: Qat anti-phage system QueC-like protein QatC [Candidatus Binatia bacterium]
MRRHVLAGRLGALDRTDISTEVGEVMTRLDLVASNKRLDFGIGAALDDLKKIGVFPSEIGLDLLVLAAHVYAADTRISRLTESQDTWTREIRLVVPVSDPARWAAATVVLKHMLDFLTGDRWTISFRARPVGFAQMVPVRASRDVKPGFDGVALFSGGLDSLVGTIDLLEQGATPLLVSHAGEGATSQAQNACFDGLKQQYKDRPFDRLRVWMSFPKDLVRGVAAEDTTRGRSFLFFAIGILAGMGLGDDFALRVAENGLISLNVPLDRLRLGSLSTRTTHPFYLSLWGDLLAALEIAGRIETPYWNKTKGEMLAGCANQNLLRQLLSKSLSCSSPSKGRWQGRTTGHCGYCLPCLIRRAAIDRAFGRGNDPTPYAIQDLTARILNTRQSEGEQVRSFQFAIDRVQSRPNLARLVIHKPGPLSSESSSRLDALADVYRRGMGEVADLLVGVRTAPI